MPYTIGWRSLRYVCPTLSKDRAKTLAHDLGNAMHSHHITTPRNAAMFIAQMAHESGEFRWKEEIWGPTVAQRGYEYRRDLGNTTKGDGYKFRGRGYIQITGRLNYVTLSHAWGSGRRFVDNPSLLASEKYAAKSAAWWFDTHGCNRAAAVGGEAAFIHVTRIINGGTNGLDDRLKYWKRAKHVSRFLAPKRVN